MKRTWRLAVISALSLTLLSGCASTESLEEKINSGDFTAGDVLSLAKNYAKEERAWDAHRVIHTGLDVYPDEIKLIDALTEYPLPAPELCITENPDGSCAVTIEDANAEGLYVAASNSCYEVPEELWEQGEINELVEEFQFTATEMGDTLLYACYREEANGQVCYSPVVSATATVTEYIPFQIGGISDDGEVFFENVFDGQVYYTLDGTDPLVDGQWKGILLEEPYLFLPSGVYTLSARCESAAGKISDLVQEEDILVEYYFGSSSSLVSEDRLYEYVTSGNGPLYRSDKQGNHREVYDNRTTQAVAAFDYLVEAEGDLAIHGEVAIRNTYRMRILYSLTGDSFNSWMEKQYIYWDDHVEPLNDSHANTLTSMNRLGRDHLRMVYKDGSVRLGNITEAYSSVKDLNQCDLRAGDVGYRVQPDSTGSLVLDNNGTALFSVSGHTVVLDAVWQEDEDRGAKVLFHYADAPTSHFVAEEGYDEWKISPNPVTNGLKVLGYTENGVYYLDGGDICRKAMNYESL